jgi:hypothetical protein
MIISKSSAKITLFAMAIKKLAGISPDQFRFAIVSPYRGGAMPGGAQVAPKNGDAYRLDKFDILLYD